MCKSYRSIKVEILDSLGCGWTSALILRWTMPQKFKNPPEDPYKTVIFETVSREECERVRIIGSISAAEGKTKLWAAI